MINESARMGSVWRSKKTGTILIRNINQHGHPGWIAIYDRPDPNPKNTYFYYQLDGWTDSPDFEELTECVVGRPRDASTPDEVAHQ